MKVILNDIIRDIEGKELTVENFENGEMTTTPLKFCSIIYNKLLSTKPKGDIQTKEYYSLAEKMYELSLVEPQEIEITDGEYMVCRNILSKERLIIQAKFLEMVNELNPVPEQPVEEPIEMHIEQPVEETTKQPIEESVEQPVDEPVEESIKEPVEELVEQPVEESVEQPIEETVEESIETHIEEPTEDTLQNVIVE